MVLSFSFPSFTSPFLLTFSASPFPLFSPSSPSILIHPFLLPFPNDTILARPFPFSRHFCPCKEWSEYGMLPVLRLLGDASMFYGGCGVVWCGINRRTCRRRRASRLLPTSSACRRRSRRQWRWTLCRHSSRTTPSVFWSDRPLRDNSGRTWTRSSLRTLPARPSSVASMTRSRLLTN